MGVYYHFNLIDLYMRNMWHVYSNVAYLIAGILSGSVVVAVGMTLLFIGSFLGHWRGGNWWKADWIGMYLAFLSIIFHHAGLPEAFYITAPAVVALTLYEFQESYFLVGLLWLISIVASYFAGVNVVPAILLYAIGLSWRQLHPSQNNKWYDLCHSMWHLCTAGAMALSVYQ